jgi:hypothetical protein
MNDSSASTILTNAIERHAVGMPVGKLESHSIDSLSARLLAPREDVETLLGNGILQSQGPVHAGDETGMHSFLSDDLNEVRRGVLHAVAGQAVEQSDGDPEGTTLMAGQALNDHAASFDKKPNAPRQFSRFPKGLVQLQSPYGDDEPGPVQKAVTTAGKVAGAGALAYGVGSYLRGRAPGVSPLAAIRAGSAANLADLKKLTGKTGGALSPGVSKVAAVLSGRAATV